MFKIWAVAETICVIFLILCLKKYRWSEIEDAFLKNDNTSVEAYNSVLDKIIHNQVAIITKPINKPLLLCGGSLISKSYVLTAAHCLQGAKQATVILTQEHFDYIENIEFTLNSSKFKIHPKWEPNILLNDIALVEVQTQKYTEIHPILLPSNGNIRSKKGTIKGWEKHSSTNKKSSLALKVQNVIIIENEECKKDFGRLIQPTNLCTQSSEFENGCHGFSGGPLIVKGVQVALVSFGTHICNIGYPTVYTRISEYMKWIEDNSDVTVSQ